MAGNRTGARPKRMPKDERRRQLLETASEIVRAEGTDSLTLGYLAERAGVTKPIAYGHFGTRAGLLIALYRQLDERQSEAARKALSDRGDTLEEVAAILSATYIDCVLQVGSQFSAIAAALAATEEMEEFRQTMRDEYIARYRAAFVRVARFPSRGIRQILVGLLGAAEALSEAASSGRTSRNDAVAALTQIVVGSLQASVGKAVRAVPFRASRR